jgi:hypothetical protein
MAMVDKNSVAAGLYAATKNQILADTQRAKAQARMWNWGGVSVGALGIGAGLWLGCAGYAATQDPETKAARAYMAAMKTPVKVTVSGEVGIKDGQQVGLAKGGMVGVSPDSTVRLDPNATVRAVADAPRPSAAQTRSNARPASGAPVVTNFYRFNRVPFGAGEVQTGWVFASSDDAKPTEQFCQYLEGENADSRAALFPLGRDGVMRLPDSAPAGVDARAAFQSCVWWTPSRSPDGEAAPPPPHVITARAKS